MVEARVQEYVVKVMQDVQNKLERPPVPAETPDLPQDKQSLLHFYQVLDS